MDPVRINAWSSPRNISTALMYSFAQRPDTRVYDEPLYAHYLRNQSTTARHPGREEILASQENDGQRVVRNLLLGPAARPVLFFKQMTHHLVGLQRDFLLEMENLLLIRNPRHILQSYAKVIPNPEMADVGIEAQYILFRELQARGHTPVVLDTERLLHDPAKLLRQTCEALVIPWYEEMLSWTPGPRSEDGVWARYWYANVHRSSGFMPYRERKDELPARLEPLAREADSYYQFLLEEALPDE